MSEGKNIDADVYKVVTIATSFLTDLELGTLYMVSLLGDDPRDVMGYDKVRGLFTEENGTRMHAATLAAYGLICKERLGI